MQPSDAAARSRRQLGFVFPSDASTSLDALVTEQRETAISRAEAQPHGCKLHPIDCEYCQDIIWPAGGLP